MLLLARGWELSSKITQWDGLLLRVGSCGCIIVVGRCCHCCEKSLLKKIKNKKYTLPAVVINDGGQLWGKGSPSVVLGLAHSASQVLGGLVSLTRNVLVSMGARAQPSTAWIAVPS